MSFQPRDTGVNGFTALQEKNKAVLDMIPLIPCLPLSRGQEPAEPARPPVQAEQCEVNAVRGAEGSGHTFPISANGSHVAKSLYNGLKTSPLNVSVENLHL